MDGRTVLITGCSSGFGKLAARTFGSRGWNVVATMRSPEKETDLAGLDGVLVTRLDVREPDSIAAAVGKASAAFGAIDAVVNNAGYGSNALFEQSPEASIRGIYETNVFGLMNVMRSTLPDMRKRGSGCIVNVTSMAGLLGLLGNSVYSSSKFAVEGLTEALALEYKPLGIRRQHGQLPRRRRRATRGALAEAPGPLRRRRRFAGRTAGPAGGCRQDLRVRDRGRGAGPQPGRRRCAAAHRAPREVADAPGLRRRPRANAASADPVSLREPRRNRAAVPV